MAWDEWKKQLAIELTKIFNLVEGSPFIGAQYIEDTGESCWREMYYDGLTPAEAAHEEATALPD